MPPESADNPNSEEPPDPWASFLRSLDETLEVGVDLHCLGGFVIAMHYGLTRGTSDIDVIAVVPHHQLSGLRDLAGEGSVLHRQYGVYLDPVTVTQCPENYEARLIPMWPRYPLQHLRLYALEAHDLALTKLERNVDVDRQDVENLAKAGFLNQATLRERYSSEFRPNLANAERHDLTLELWVDICWPGEGRIPKSEEPPR